MDTSSIPGLELIQVADVVAREKSIEREEAVSYTHLTLPTKA